jgi:molybdate transport system regulatory protein
MASRTLGTKRTRTADGALTSGAPAGRGAAPRPSTRQPAPWVLDAELRLNVGGKALLGERRVSLLAEIGRLGSITHAARAAGLSYKGAWDALEQMNNLVGEAVVERVAGGKSGGHTHLTPRGAQLVHNFGLIREEYERFLSRLNAQALGLTRDYVLLEGIAMKTSARNQFAGTVEAIRPGAVNDEIDLAVIGGIRLVATITRESRQSLGLELGSRAFALVKASSVILLTEADGARFSARNQLPGSVSRVAPGAVNTEVVLDLAGGGSVAAIITNESARKLELAVGKTATAIFKASSLIVGVAA